MKLHKLGALAAFALSAGPMLAAQAQPLAAAEAGERLPQIIEAKPGESASEAVHRAMQERMFAAFPPAERAALAHPTSISPKGTGPRITSGTIVSQTLNVAVAPGLAPIVQIQFRAKEGLNYVFLTFVSAHGQVIYSVYYLPSYAAPTKGSFEWQNVSPLFERDGGPPGLYAEAGTWTLTAAKIVDEKYIATAYDTKQLASLFTPPSFTVINHGTQDYTPPVVSAGKILTHVVDLSQTNPVPAFKAELTISDDVSGVAYPIVVVQYQDQAPGEMVIDYLDTPKLSGTFKTAIPAVLLQLEGIWTITAYGAVDVAGNEFLDDNAADVIKLFGKDTFKVKRSNGD